MNLCGEEEEEENETRGRMSSDFTISPPGPGQQLAGASSLTGGDGLGGTTQQQLEQLQLEQQRAALASHQGTLAYFLSWFFFFFFFFFFFSFFLVFWVGVFFFF